MRKIRLTISIALLAATVTFGSLAVSRTVKADIQPVGGLECNCVDGWTNRDGLLCTMDGRMRCCPGGCYVIAE